MIERHKIEMKFHYFLEKKRKKKENTITNNIEYMKERIVSFFKFSYSQEEMELIGKNCFFLSLDDFYFEDCMIDKEYMINIFSVIYDVKKILFVIKKLRLKFHQNFTKIFEQILNLNSNENGKEENKILKELIEKISFTFEI